MRDNLPIISMVEYPDQPGRFWRITQKVTDLIKLVIIVDYLDNRDCPIDRDVSFRAVVVFKPDNSQWLIVPDVEQSLLDLHGCDDLGPKGERIIGYEQAESKFGSNILEHVDKILHAWQFINVFLINLEGSLLHVEEE